MWPSVFNFSDPDYIAHTNVYNAFTLPVKTQYMFFFLACWKAGIKPLWTSAVSSERYFFLWPRVSIKYWCRLSKDSLVWYQSTMVVQPKRKVMLINSERNSRFVVFFFFWGFEQITVQNSMKPNGDKGEMTPLLSASKCTLLWEHPDDTKKLLKVNSLAHFFKYLTFSQKLVY